MFYPIEDSRVWYYSCGSVPSNWISPSFTHPGWKELPGCVSVPDQPSISHFVTYFKGELELASYEVFFQYDHPISIYLNGNRIFSDIPKEPTNYTLIRSGLEIQPLVNSLAVELNSSMDICLHLLGNVNPDSSDCVEVIPHSISSSALNVSAAHDYDYLTVLASNHPIQVDFFFHNTSVFCHSNNH